MTAAAGALGLATVDLAANALGAKVGEQLGLKIISLPVHQHVWFIDG